LFYLISSILVLLDQLSKLLAMVFFKKPLVIVNNFLSLSYLENRGAAFGLFSNYPFLLILVGFLTLVFMIFLYSKFNKTYYLIPFAILFAGACSNFIDRIFRGYVIDFISFSFFPTFNFADIFINVGVFVLLFLMIKDKY